MIFSKKIPLHEIVTSFVCPECCPKGIPEGLPRGDARGATRGTYSSSDIPPILDRMLFSPSEVGTVSIFLGIFLGLCPREIPQKILTVPPSDGENISDCHTLYIHGTNTICTVFV